MRLTKRQLRRIIREEITKESMGRRVGRVKRGRRGVFQNEEQVGYIEELMSDDGECVGFGIYLSDGSLFRAYTIHPRGQSEEFNMAVQDYESQAVHAHSNFRHEREALEVAKQGAQQSGISLG